MILEDADRIREELSNIEKTNVKIGLFGQPGAGKSSLINALTGTELCKPGVENDMVPGKPVEWNGLLFVDLPGFGTTKYPRESYLKDFDIASFDLILCVFAGKWREVDNEFFSMIMELDRQYLFIRNKCDDIWEKGFDSLELRERIISDVKKLINEDINIYFTSCRTDEGLGELTEAIFQRLKSTKREKWVREAKAFTIQFLEEKRKACEKLVAIAAAASLANALHAIPGLGIAVDITTLSQLFNNLKRVFGIDDEALTLIETIAPQLAGMANKVVQYAAREGVIILLKQFVGKEVLKEFSKYIPIIGQAVAAGTGYAITTNAGNAYLNYCYEIAKAILENELGIKSEG